jgi:hypothetical protein
MSKSKLYYSKIEIDGRCLDLLFTESEIVNASRRAENPKNAKYIPDGVNTCWSVEQPPDCSFWSQILGICDRKK